MKLLFPGLLFVGLGTWLVTTQACATEVLPAKPAYAAIERGRVLLEKDDFPAAIQAFSEVLRLNPKSVPAYIGRGTAYRMLEEFVLALAHSTWRLKG